MALDPKSYWRRVPVQIYGEDGPASPSTPLSVLPGTQALDAFARQRVSQPVTLFDSKLLYDKAPLFWDESITNGSTNAASTWENSSVVMHVEAGDTIIRQSKQWMNYQPGKSQLISMTGILAHGAGVVSRMGSFETNNGLFLQSSSDVVSFVVRNQTVDTVIPQSTWNTDKFDGAGPSGFTIDFTKAQIFFVDYEWLGVGKVRFGFFLDGLPWVAHTITHINALTSPYIRTPNLPVRYEVSSGVGGAIAEMVHICSSVVTEGSSAPNGVVRTFSTGGTNLDAEVADTIYALIGVRLKSTHFDTTIWDEAINVMNETAQDFEWMLLLNPTVAGTFTYADVANSALQVAYGVTANTITEGSWDVMFGSGFMKNTNQAGSPVSTVVDTSLRIGSKIDGTPDELVLAVRPLGAGADIQGSMTVREIV